jgi:hypothetical protein
MESSSQKQESIADVLRQAKRAQEIISNVDFQKILRHDPTEVSKLQGVSDALEKLANGQDVGLIEGIDEVRNSDPRQAWIAALLELLDAAGYSDRVGRVFSLTSGEAAGQWKPLALVPHREGIPLHDLCLAFLFQPPGCLHCTWHTRSPATAGKSCAASAMTAMRSCLPSSPCT